MAKVTLEEMLKAMKLDLIATITDAKGNPAFIVQTIKPRKEILLTKSELTKQYKEYIEKKQGFDF